MCSLKKQVFLNLASLSSWFFLDISLYQSLSVFSHFYQVAALCVVRPSLVANQTPLNTRALVENKLVQKPYQYVPVQLASWGVGGVCTLEIQDQEMLPGRVARSQVCLPSVTMLITVKWYPFKVCSSTVIDYVSGNQLWKHTFEHI